MYVIKKQKGIVALIGANGVVLATGNTLQEAHRKLAMLWQ